jgi:hypothetical protein
MEAVNAVDNPTTKKWKTRQDTIDQEDIITNGQRTMKYHTLVNNHTWSASTHQQSASGRQNRGKRVGNIQLAYGDKQQKSTGKHCRCAVGKQSKNKWLFQRQ